MKQSPPPTATTSHAAWVASLPPAARRQALEQLTDAQVASWAFWGRPEQFAPPTDVDAPWFAWLILAGRGWGKTRTGAEFVIERVRSGRYGRVALVAETAADARDVMVEGPSGLLHSSPPSFRPRYQPSKRRLTWPNGATATTFAGREPDQLRGPQFDLAWMDELAKYAYPQATWDNLAFGMRLESSPAAPPQVCVTTTPRPLGLLRVLLSDPDVVVTRGSSYENLANLSPAFIRRVIRRYEGTTVGQQELHARVLDEAPGALWTRALLEAARADDIGALDRAVVGVDPSTSADGSGDLCGVVAVGMLSRTDRWGTAMQYGAVLEDASLSGGPSVWAEAVVRCAVRHGADAVVVEGNQGGALVREVVQDAARRLGVTLPPVRVVHARRSKAARAAPVVALYEQGRVWHPIRVPARQGRLDALEDELVSWVPGGGGPSPNRLDALVWAATHLLVGVGGRTTEVTTL